MGFTHHSAFSGPLNKLLSPAVDTMASHIKEIVGLQKGDRERIVDCARDSLTVVLHDHLARTLLQELHLARKEERLFGPTNADRWQHFIALASRPGFRHELHAHYPGVPARIDALLRNRCTATIAFARAWAADHESLDTLCGGAPGLLQDLRFDAGESHRQGRTVVIVTCDGGKLVYRPRPANTDTALASFLRNLGDAHSEPITATLPRTLTQAGHSWAAFVRHRYASNEKELRSFYRGIGQWLGVLRLLGGTDMHARNLIADGAHPVIVDCETLFTPRLRAQPSGYGDAVDRAGHWIQGTVLGIGMLPGRSQGSTWRGVDVSSVGAPPDQQPSILRPVILDAGTDEARWAMTPVLVPISHNQPSPRPVLMHYWPEVVEGFDRINRTLRHLDAAGLLAPRLDGFADCTIRVAPRPTKVYVELARMLWHPVSMQNEEKATENARELLRSMAANSGLAPDDTTVIDAEIADLKEGDIPYFFTVASHGQLQGPGNTRWLQPCNLINAAFDHWRAADLPMERRLIHAALASAYLNERGSSEDNVSPGDKLSANHRAALQQTLTWPTRPYQKNLDQRRRGLLQGIMQDLSRHAVHGEDGTVTWLSPGLDPDTGWSIRPMPQDLYSGLAGVALLLAAYLHESRAGRVDAIQDVDTLLRATLSTLRKAEDKYEQMLADPDTASPLPPGGYLGLGGLIWTWLTLDKLGSGSLQSGHALESVNRARALARLMSHSVNAHPAVDVLGGLAGAIPPLLALAHRTSDANYMNMAKEFGDKLMAGATWKDKRYAFWAEASRPQGLGGFAHGATGIGWALTKLSRASRDSHYEQAASGAFAFEESLYDTRTRDWLDRPGAAGGTGVAAWCHGAVGIGLAHLDLDPDLRSTTAKLVVRRAALAVWRTGLGHAHGLCHGDASAWEFLDGAIAKGEGPPGISREALLAQWLTQLERYDVPRGIVSNSFARGFMTGTAGIAYQLLRAGQGSNLPSVLTLGG